MPAALLVFLGGGIGALLRYGTGILVGGPLATFTVNAAGCFAIGLIAAAVPDHVLSARLFFITGLLGGFTTFSAFSIDALTLWQRGDAGAALLYVAGTLVVSLAAAALGLALGRAM